MGGALLIFEKGPSPWNASELWAAGIPTDARQRLVTNMKPIYFPLPLIEVEVPEASCRNQFDMNLLHAHGALSRVSIAFIDSRGARCLPSNKPLPTSHIL